ncbi:Protein ALTERED PHOSPHATE STARVATION RESPONSE 1 [Linum perenne]
MGCFYSRIEREEMVSRCKARKKYMKQLVQTCQFMSTSHLMYLRALRSTGSALIHFSNIEANLHHHHHLRHSYTHNHNHHHLLPLAIPSPSPSLPPVPPASTPSETYHTFEPVSPLRELKRNRRRDSTTDLSTPEFFLSSLAVALGLGLL